MVFDLTINLGHVITLVGILITFITWGQGIKWQLTNIDERVKLLERNQEEQTKLIIANAVMNTNIMSLTDKLANLERRISEAEIRRKYPVS